LCLYHVAFAEKFHGSAEWCWILIGTILIKYMAVSRYKAVQRINLKQVTVLYVYASKESGTNE